MVGIKECIRATAAGLVLVMTVIGGAGAPLHAQTPSAALAPTLVRLLQRQPAQPVQLPDGRTLQLASRHLVVSDMAGHGASRVYPLPKDRIGAAAVALSDGRILIWGGLDDAGEPIAEGWWFDVATGHFAPAVDTGLPPVAGESLTVLSDGDVLVAGGGEGLPRGTQRLTRWHPSSGVASPLASTLPVTAGATATLQRDGTVLLSGGWNSNGMKAKGLQQFDPSAESLTATDHGVADADNLSVVASLPVSNSTDNAPDTPISVRLSQPIDPRTVSSATVSLIGPAGPVQATVASVQDGRLIFVTPPRDLLTDTAYTLVLAGVRGVHGQPLPFTSIEFRIAALPAPDMSGVKAITARKSTADGSTATASGGAMSAIVGGSAALLTLYRSTGVDVHGMPFAATPCNVNMPAPHLCRTTSYIKDGAWYPGQNNAGQPGNGHWRLNRPDMSAAAIAQNVMARQTALRASRMAPRAGATASLQGTLELIDDRPVAHVQITLGTARAYTDAHGRFTLSGVPSGRQLLYVDGGTADAGGADVWPVRSGRQCVARSGQPVALPHVPAAHPRSRQDRAAIAHNT